MICVADQAAGKVPLMSAQFGIGSEDKRQRQDRCNSKSIMSPVVFADYLASGGQSSMGSMG